MGDAVRSGVCTMVGVIGSLIASQFGGWDAALSTLILFMAVDYITGLVVAGVFHASPKSKDGALESRAGWKGLCRKGVTLLIVLVACHLDTVMGSNFIRDATVIAFIANETLSIIENAGLMGVPIPKALTGAIEILRQKSEQDNQDNMEERIMGNFKISTATIVRTACLLLALANQVLSAMGRPIIPIESSTVEQLVTAGITTVAALIAWWNNNSFTKEAIQADNVMETLKKQVH